MHRLLLCLASLTVLTHPSWSSSAERLKNFRVVIDPGHGGSDQGTVYDRDTVRIAEKDITLQVALETVRFLRARGIDTVLTRSSDQEIPLPARTALANRLSADVFISIHVNSTSTPMVSDAEGIETFILNNTSDASSRRLAHLENSVIKGSNLDRIHMNAAAPLDNAGKIDVALILKDLRLDANLSESKRLACALQTQLVLATTKPGLIPTQRPSLRQRNRGVKQALFHVLLGADMPSALVEIGFLTSPRDRSWMLSPVGRQSLARAISQAVDGYRRDQGQAKAHSALSRCKIH